MYVCCYVTIHKPYGLNFWFRWKRKQITQFLNGIEQIIRKTVDVIQLVVYLYLMFNGLWLMMHTGRKMKWKTKTNNMHIGNNQSALLLWLFFIHFSSHFPFFFCIFCNRSNALDWRTEKEPQHLWLGELWIDRYSICSSNILSNWLSIPIIICYITNRQQTFAYHITDAKWHQSLQLDLKKKLILNM